MVFEPALTKLRESDRPVFGPTSFRGYVDRHGIEAGRTPRYISVDASGETSETGCERVDAYLQYRRSTLTASPC